MPKWLACCVLKHLLFGSIWNAGWPRMAGPERFTRAGLPLSVDLPLVPEPLEVAGKCFGFQMVLKVKVKLLSHVQLFATPWTIAHQAPHSMGFSRQECWSGLLFPSPGDLPDPGIEPGSPALQADALRSELPGKPFL